MINSNFKIILLKKYLNAIIPTLGLHRITNEYYNFRCNICGDSKKSKVKKRAYIYILDKVFFKCYNCNYKISIDGWFKKYFPSFYKQYIKEILMYNKKEKLVKEKENLDKLKDTNKKFNILQEKNDVSNFISLNNTEDLLVKKAILFCKKRKIKEEHWSKWFVCKTGLYSNRLIIPFYNNKKQIYYYQARTLINNHLKYINRKFNRDKAIYNYYNIDKSKKVISVEGPIDSLFINNCIATLGVNPSKDVENKLNNLNCYYIFDNDDAGNTASKKKLKNKKYVFLWNKFIEDMELPKKNKWDFNDVYIYLNRTTNFTFNELEPYFTNNKYDLILIK